MKKALQLVVLIAFSVCVYGQVPQAFNYQAILRNSDGTVKKNELVSLQLGIVDDQGTSVYLESHNTSTNEFGLLQVVLGRGTSSDDLTAIDWSSGPYFLDVSVNGETLGTSPLLSVPYALYAASGLTPWHEQNGTISYSGDFVGIGTDSPGEKLEVDGNLKVRGELILEGDEGEPDIHISELLELLRNEGIVPANYSGNLTDIDGNVYPTISLGDQVWMAKNLKVSRFADASPISSVQILEHCGECSGYYSWYSIMDESVSSSANPSGVQSICPAGWHLPSLAEWEELLNYLGGSDMAGGQMKEEGTGCWNSPNTGASNVSGFSALPAGWQDWEFERAILHAGEGAYFWTATEQDMDHAIILRLFHDSNMIRTEALFSSLGASVRCVKD